MERRDKDRVFLLKSPFFRAGWIHEFAKIKQKILEVKKKELYLHRDLIISPTARAVSR